MVTLHTAIALVLMSWTGFAADAQDSVTRRLDRIDRLQQWLDAVGQHEFGSADDALLRVASWDRNTLWLVWQDVSSVVSLVREPSTGVFYTPIEPEPFSGVFRLPQPRPRTRVIPYGRDDINRLRLIAKQVTDRGGEDRILKRGATLHAEIAVLGPVLPVPDSSRRPRSDSIMLYLADGQQTGVDDASVQWEMGRRLLDKVKPKESRKLGADPGADETVRLWYLASNLYMQSVEQTDAWHVERSVQLFPQDPEVLFVAACAREIFSGPQIQSVLLSTTLSRDLFKLYGDEGEELRRAEKLYRESLERDPNRAEARIRLGRVLNRRGRHQDAIVELRRATAGTKNRLLLYYGNLFLGDAADALGLAEEARRAYQRASELFELAQSPRLALSAMAARAGDRSGALAAIEEVLARDQPARADDPWWSYYIAQTRDLEGVWTALRVAVTAERPRR
ncbi:MAG TPA: tetratricopeptide repeat protein [Vicinamibacterales bacterium]|nr:tetratricopeptide repeat protein [Vicinamibacterales bacterium]